MNHLFIAITLIITATTKDETHRFLSITDNPVTPSGDFTTPSDETTTPIVKAVNPSMVKAIIPICPTRTILSCLSLVSGP